MRIGKSSTSSAISIASTATRRTSATCSRAWREIRPEVDSKYLYDLFPDGPGQAGGQGGRPAAAAGQGRLLMSNPGRLRRRPGERPAGAARRRTDLMAKLRLKSQWFKTDAPKSPQETAGAMAFIVWRVAHNALTQMRSARFDIDIGAQYFAFMREWLVFLIQVVDRMAHERMAADERVAFTTALVRRVADHLADNEDRLLGVPPPGEESHQGRFIDLVQPARVALRRLRPRRRRPGLRVHALPGPSHRGADAGEGPALGGGPGDGHRSARGGARCCSAACRACCRTSRAHRAAAGVSGDLR